MRPVRVAINGFGRIGRTLLRQLLHTGNNIFKVVAVNDLQPVETLLYLFQYDSVHGSLPSTIGITQEADYFFAGNQKIKTFSERSPEKLPWRNLDVDIVIDGIFPTYPLLAKHLEAGAKRVVLTAPAKDKEVFTFTPGVNEKNLTKNHLITSNASCTTNAAVPIIKSVLLPLGIRRLQIGTIHAYTASQTLVDSPVGKKDLRGSRAAAENIIPSTTGASQAIPLLFPELKGKVDGYSIRVPVPNGSLVVLTTEVEQNVSCIAELNSAIIKAARLDDWRFRKILGTTNEPVVSRDIIGNDYGSFVDLGMTSVIDGYMLTIGAWYDNEWGYCSMLKHHLFKVARTAGFIS